MLLLSLTMLASAGYGDPVGGLPSPAERELALWTNAARVDPAAFKAEYRAGGCSFDADFSEDERTPKDPYLWNADLAEAARAHTDDMFDNGFFSHTSSDGTKMGDRVAEYYAWSRVGENIASGQPNPYTAVFQAWMCSTSGHRGAIMSGSFNELGTGVVGTLYTQDFGFREQLERRIAMGVGNPESGRAMFRGDWNGPVPDVYEVVWNGTSIPMNLEVGTAKRGVYRTSAELGEATCHQWYLRSLVGESEQRFPEHGSYGWGDCDFDDVDAKWIATQLDPELDGGGCGCRSAGGGAPGAVLGLLGLLAMRRRRR